MFSTKAAIASWRFSSSCSCSARHARSPLMLPSNRPNEIISSSSRTLRAWYARRKPGGEAPSGASQARRNWSNAPGLRRRALRRQSIFGSFVRGSGDAKPRGYPRPNEVRPTVDRPAAARRRAAVPSVRERRAADRGRRLRGARPRTVLRPTAGQGGAARGRALGGHIPRPVRDLPEERLGRLAVHPERAAAARHLPRHLASRPGNLTPAPNLWG